MAKKEVKDLFGASIKEGDHVICPDDHATAPFRFGVVRKICNKTIKVEWTSGKEWGIVYKRPGDQAIKVTETMKWLLDE